MDEYVISLSFFKGLIYISRKKYDIKFMASNFETLQDGELMRNPL